MRNAALAELRVNGEGADDMGKCSAGDECDLATSRAYVKRRLSADSPKQILKMCARWIAARARAGDVTLPRRLILASPKIC